MYKKNIKEKSTTAVILCLYIRLSNLSSTIKCLENQTNKDFDLYISNNSNKSSDILQKFFAKKTLSFNVTIQDFFNEHKQFSRFLVAKELAKSGYEKIIFIDDDEIIPRTFIQDCYDQFDPDFVKSFYAHLVLNNYWDKVKLKPGQIGNYAGTGGLICESQIFLSDKFFECPKEFYIIDDLWLSHYLLKYTDKKIGLLDTNIEFIQDGKATAIGLKKEKREFADQYILPYSQEIIKRLNHGII